MDCSMPGFPVHQLLELIQTHVHRVGDAIQPSRPLLLLPPIFPSIRVFSNESVPRMRWPKYWSFSISPSNEYTELISFKIDWLDLLTVQGTLKSLLQHNSKASILRCSAFFMVQLSHPYMTTGKKQLYYIDLCQQSDLSASHFFNLLPQAQTVYLCIIFYCELSWASSLCLGFL